MNIDELLKKYHKIFLVKNENKDELVCEVIRYCNEHHKNILFLDNEEMYQLYNTYEFSDKVKCLTESKQYGNIFNFVRNGVITLDEAIEALIH